MISWIKCIELQKPAFSLNIDTDQLKDIVTWMILLKN
jgi:hypothetical protein